MKAYRLFFLLAFNRSLLPTATEGDIGSIAKTAEGSPVGVERGWQLSWGSESDILAELNANGLSVQGAFAGVGGDPALPLLRYCIARSWWIAARELVALAHSRDSANESRVAGFSSVAMITEEVSELIRELKRQADTFGAFAEETYRGQTDGLVEVPCAVQWAQNSSHVFLGVKYAARWSAPGAIELVDLVVNLTATGFQLSAFGHHSSIRKRYVVNLDLNALIDPDRSTWSASSVGRMTATLQKVSPGKWKGLTANKIKSKHPITKWMDMQEKWHDELEGVKASKKAAEGSAKDKVVDEKKSAKPEISRWSRFTRSWTQLQTKILKMLGLRRKKGATSKLEQRLRQLGLGCAVFGVIALSIVAVWRSCRRNQSTGGPRFRGGVEGVALRTGETAEATRAVPEAASTT